MGHGIHPPLALVPQRDLQGSSCGRCRKVAGHSGGGHRSGEVQRAVRVSLSARGKAGMSSPSTERPKPNEPCVEGQGKAGRTVGVGAGWEMPFPGAAGSLAGEEPPFPPATSYFHRSSLVSLSWGLQGSSAPHLGSGKWVGWCKGAGGCGERGESGSLAPPGSGGGWACSWSPCEDWGASSFDMGGTPGAQDGAGQMWA